MKMISQEEWLKAVKDLDRQISDSKFVINNYPELQKKYGGQVIAVHEGKVISSAKSLDLLFEEMPKNHINEVCFYQIFKEAN
jgi:hypothetical protein